MEKKATIKKSIKPVTFTVTVTASRVNENGTFSGIQIESVKGPNDTAYAVAPPMGGGAVYFKVDTLKGITVFDDDAPTTSVKKKLF